MKIFIVRVDHVWCPVLVEVLPNNYLKFTLGGQNYLVGSGNIACYEFPSNTTFKEAEQAAMDLNLHTEMVS